jgi:putative acetyltransferase
MAMLIRPEEQEDIVQIHEVNLLAFGQENEAKLVDLLRESNAFIPGLSLVAVIDNEIVGHILFSKITIVSETSIQEAGLALAPMAVRPDRQKQGIGSRLVKAGLNKARELGYKSVIVLGHEQYYPRFGFIPAVKWNIKAPFDVPENVFMAIELVPDSLANVSGTVRYPDEFEDVCENL